MGKTILVTGAAGAIGSNLANRLSEDTGNRVIILDDLSAGHAENIQARPNVRFIQGSVESDEHLQLVFEEKIDLLFHLAANFANQNSVDFPQRDLEVNGTGTLKLLLRAAKHGMKRFLYTSSSCVYGNRSEPLDEKCREFSLDTPYGITKLLGEQYVQFFAHHHGLDTVILRYFNVYGPNEYPGRYRNVIAIFFYRAMRNEEIVITGSGEETRDFNYVDDTVRATLLASEKGSAKGQVFNVASGKETKVKDLVDLILRITGSRSKVVYRERRSWDTVTRRTASVEQARRILGYQPQVNLETGLVKYHDWLKKQDLNKCKW